MEKVEQELKQLNSDLNGLTNRVAELAPVNELIKYLLFFWAAISAVLGLFGWQKISDIDEDVREKVRQEVVLFLPESERDFEQFSENVAASKSLKDDWEGLISTFRSSAKYQEFIQAANADFDLPGRLNRLLLRSDVDIATDEDFRTEAIATLELIKQKAATGEFPSDFLFNAIQFARRIENYRLATEIAEQAISLDPKPITEAISQSLITASSSGAAADQAFARLMEIVNQEVLSPEAHLILAEAWNAAERLRRHEELIRELDRTFTATLADGQSVPAYYYAIAATLTLRIGGQNSKERAEDFIDAGLRELEGQTRLALGYLQAQRELAEAIEYLRPSEN
ncbi:MAG: hypothetical protein AAFQ58_21365 [Pseudomonadota bacterium]